jgi:hypothetical protein
MKIFDIKWDTDGEDVELPTEMDVPDDLAEDEITDYLSDKTGFCVYSWESDTREICVAYELTVIHSEYINVPKTIDNSEIEDWLDRNGKLDDVRELAEDDARNYDFCYEDYAITDEKGRDIKTWR